MLNLLKGVLGYPTTVEARGIRIVNGVGTEWLLNYSDARGLEEETKGYIGEASKVLHKVVVKETVESCTIQN